jgi:outer membrane protein assembly factor BamB
MNKLLLAGAVGLALVLASCSGNRSVSVDPGIDNGSTGGSLSAGPADWPQWRGPDRTDVSRETGLLADWPTGGPPLVWTCDQAGIGFSGPAVVGDHVYLLGARGDTEYVLAFDNRTGKEVWSSPIGPLFTNGWGDGPRSTPTVDGDRIYALGAQGQLVCVETAGGKKVWGVSLPDDLQGQMMSGWGYTESPLVDGDRVICCPGGRQGTVAALDKKTGKVVWRSQGLTDPAAYSSLIAAEVDGLRQYINMTGRGVASVAAADGRQLWHSDLAHNGTAVIPTPIFHAGYVYVTSGYAAGCGLLHLTRSGDGIGAAQVYANKEMSNHHGGVVRVGTHLYGYSDKSGGAWICQEFGSGKVVWSERRPLGKGSLTYADGRLYCYTEDDGTAALVEASPEGWKEHGRFTIPRHTSASRKGGKIWTHPVVAGGRLYLRDQELLFCFNIKGG